jgi:choline dehydrogenase-like flavoprotein
VIFDYPSVASRDIDTDLCIVGAGPAGLAIAHAMIGAPIDVCLLESGGFAGEARTQMLCEGASIGAHPLDPGRSRLRAFGGSCNLWGGGCIPLAPLEVARREWIPYGGWPLSYAELEAWYTHAKSFCRIGEHEFRNGSSLCEPRRAPLRFRGAAIVHRAFAMSPIVFGAAYRGDLERARNVAVLLHANLLGLETSPSASAVTHARVGSLDGHAGSVRARCYVLATGAIENARLLLLSDSVARDGLGNDRGLVGRFLMDHPAIRLGTLHIADAERLASTYRHAASGPGTSACAEICLSDEVQQKQRLLNARMQPYAVEAPPPRGIAALRGLRTSLRLPTRDEGERIGQSICAALRHAGAPDATGPRGGIGRHVLALGLGIGDVARALARRLAGQPTVESRHVDLIGFFEQAPNADSRVTLGMARDALGQRQVRVDWRLTALDWRTYRAASMIFGNTLAEALSGEFRADPVLAGGDDDAVEVRGRAHHIGTTRMSSSAADGVVDTDCRVHGIDNLYIAGSSVFPTGGWAYPTLTIVALALRLAEHLKLRLARCEREIVSTAAS